MNNPLAGGGPPRELTLAPIDLTGFRGVTMTVALANSTPGDEWEGSDFLIIELDTDNDGTDAF